MSRLATLIVLSGIIVTACQPVAADEFYSVSDHQPAAYDDSPCCPGWFTDAELINLRLRRRGLDFALPTNGAATVVGVGGVEDVEFGRDMGIRVGLGYLTRQGWGIGFRYTNFDTDGGHSAVAPGGGNLWATRSHPAANEQAATAIATAALNFQMFDFEASRWLAVNDYTAVRLFGGLRWLNAKQEFMVNYDGADFSNAIVRDNIADNGFGVRAGAEGHWNLTCGWSLFARGAATIAYSRSELSLFESNNSGATTIVSVTDNFTRPISNIEAAIGATWKWGSWTFSGGYELNHWFNLGNRTTFDDVHEGAYDPVSFDVVLEGFFVQSAFVW